MATDTTKVDTAAKTTVEPANEMSYQVPSPKEMLFFIRQVGGKNNKRTDMLNNPDNAKNYTDSKSQALNFGVYSCDLTYCSVFEIGSDALKYFKSVKQLGDQVGVAKSVSPDIVKRLEKNMGNSDSIVEIADNLYFSSFESLQNGQQGNTLALTVAGGYIEGLYIATQLVKYSKGDPAVGRIADEKYTLENILEFMKKYESDAGVKETLEKFRGLEDTFNKVEAKAAAEKVNVKKQEKGGHVLGGGEEIQLTQDEYKTICDKVAEIRNSITGK